MIKARTKTDPIFLGVEIDWLFMQSELYRTRQLAARGPECDPDSAGAVHQREEDGWRPRFAGTSFYNSDRVRLAGVPLRLRPRSQTLKWDAWGYDRAAAELDGPGVYRGGSRGEDLYARIYGGIGPSGMTAFHDRRDDGFARHAGQDLGHRSLLATRCRASRDRKRMQEMDSEVGIEP